MMNFSSLVAGCSWPYHCGCSDECMWKGSRVAAVFEDFSEDIGRQGIGRVRLWWEFLPQVRASSHVYCMLTIFVLGLVAGKVELLRNNENVYEIAKLRVNISCLADIDDSLEALPDGAANQKTQVTWSCAGQSIHSSFLKVQADGICFSAAITSCEKAGPFWEREGISKRDPSRF